MAFSKELDEQLVEDTKNMEGVMTNNMKHWNYQLVLWNNIDRHFNNETKLDGIGCIPF